ncbi:helix-turn-helix domain-containing protein [Streptomyces sp. NBC_01262]|uniref:helix-turn-helix domain-containing protein n=1 Tax=Streptomyces sp. NBC_01262 TaxID=2903803 RepID=UPI002E32328C|nr:helix-turn-helix transcriptional regulator [Streptomyces sp. NBC_01262]
MTATGEVSQPPVAWRYCGNQVKLWREGAGVTREQLAQESNYGYDTVKSMELGRRRPTLRLLEVADGMCGAHGKLLAAQEFLRPEPFPSYSMSFVRDEAEAIARYEYEAQHIPGLLQTEEYARELMATHWPPLGEETIEERVAARLERQSLLRQPTKSFSFVIEEAALRRQFGGEGAYQRQLEQLLAVGEQRNVTVQAMLTARGLHAGLYGPFVLLETPEHKRLAYEEGQITGVLYDDPDKVSTIARRHDMIARQALGLEESARFIRKLAEEQ